MIQNFYRLHVADSMFELLKTRGINHMRCQVIFLINHLFVRLMGPNL